MIPALDSCAQSQNVMPALGKRSETGIIAEPMMPNACSIPCACRTLMNASSVVIFILGALVFAALTCNRRATPKESAMKAGPFFIDERELSESFARASGPGGQNVNKVSTAVELRFDPRRSPGLPAEVAERLIQIAGSRATQEGVIVIFAQRFSSQPRNREDARERLAGLIERAAHRDKPRRPTRPTLASKKRRLDAKSRRGEVKALRGPTGED